MFVFHQVEVYQCFPSLSLCIFLLYFLFLQETEYINFFVVAFFGSWENLMGISIANFYFT